MVRNGTSLEAAHASVKQLIGEKLKYLVPMTVIFIVGYIGLTILAGFAKDLMGTKVIGSVNLGFVLIAFNYLLSWVLAIVYAVKHGALANEGGCIGIRWSVSPGAVAPSFEMSWTETAGPPVMAPRRSGFGRTVMERMTAAALGGKATLQFDPAGIVWRLVCPAARVLDGQ